MELEKGLLISLTDNKEYIVMASIILDDIKYVCLSENEKMENIKFCVEEIEMEQIKLTEVDSPNLRQKLLVEFTNIAKQDMSE